MYLGIIPIDETSIPYKFSVSIFNSEYIFEVRYNETADIFTLGLYDTADNLICVEPIVYNVPLFEQHYQPNKYPSAKIIPKDLSGQETAVTWDNFFQRRCFYM